MAITHKYFSRKMESDNSTYQECYLKTFKDKYLTVLKQIIAESLSLFLVD